MTAESLIGNNDLKFVFVGGKGGVGKTTTSAAIAMQFSYDRKVLLLSTDPAHSLSDAFKKQFTEEPQEVEGIPNLDVLEVNPDKVLAAEVERWKTEAEQAGFTELLTNVKEFQEWLVSVPGIDEATALSNVIEYIEKGSYDVIVFDTAPTGHTLKLLQMPKVLEAGLNKLNSWQSKLWGYWSTIKGAASGQGNLKAIQVKVTKRLSEYKTSIEKIGVMLKDQQRTNFTVVCIAEHLSINESLRLLKELKHYGISVSHIIVNQLVQDALNIEEMENLYKIFNQIRQKKQFQNPADSNVLEQMLPRLKKSVELCNSRKAIQQGYLNKLKQFDQVKSNEITVVEVPLLPSEVTGIEALLSFSQLLMPEGCRSQEPTKLEEWKPSPFTVNVPQTDPEFKVATTTTTTTTTTTKNQEETEEKKDVEKTQKVELHVGDSVRIDGLKSSAQYNDLVGKVFKTINEKNRVGVLVEYQNVQKKLLLKKGNLTKIEVATPKKSTGDETQQTSPGSGMDSFKDKILADPEVQEKLKNPKFKAAWDACSANPAMAFQYMGDPEIGPFIMKMMTKLRNPDR